MESTPSAGALRAVVVSGLLLAVPGGLLPLWGYHMQTDFARAGNYFLAMGAGLALGGAVTQKWGARLGIARLLMYACFVAAAALAGLAFSAPPADIWLGFGCLFLTGAAAGALNAGVLQTIGAAWQANPAGVTLAGGIFFAGGSALCCVLLGWCFEAANAPRFLAILASVPVIAGASMLCASTWPRPVHFPDGHAAKDAHEEAARQMETGSDVRGGLGLLFALLLFFQFANEWSIAGWLPIFLIDRLGISPQSAVDLLALYWLALAGGRLGATRLLRHMPPGALVAASAFCALFGCSALLAANTRFGTVMGVFVAGMGFSAIYPLASEKMSSRFSSWRPGYFNGIFTFALLGGMLTPFALGHLAAELGLQVIPLAVMGGSCAVLVLLLVLWLGRHILGY